jgi:L-alanine-DL-glutamate epimerase-like enolase superfamily enzyme
VKRRGSTLRITKVEAEALTLPLIRPFITSFAVWRDYKNVLVRVETDSGIVGIGEAAPTPQYDGETQEGTMEKIRNFLAPAVIDCDPFELTTISRRMEAALVGSRPAKAAVDMALYDILGKAFEVPVYQILGGLVQPSFTSARCLSFKPADEMVAGMRACIDEGYTTFEVKMSGSPEDDMQHIAALISAVPEDIVMIFDPNEKWGVSNAIKLGLLVTDKWGALPNVYFEQPVPRADLQGMALVRSRTPIQIVADEPVTSAEAVFEIARVGAADMVNIKIMKVGGIRRCLDAIAVAEAAGIRYRIDCMGESKIANTAGAHLAAATNHELADLDVHMNITGEASRLFRGGLTIVDGKVRVPTGPGLGVGFKM